MLLCCRSLIVHYGLHHWLLAVVWQLNIPMHIVACQLLLGWALFNFLLGSAVFFFFITFASVWCIIYMMMIQELLLQIIMVLCHIVYLHNVFLRLWSTVGQKVILYITLSCSSALDASSSLSTNAASADPLCSDIMSLDSGRDDTDNVEG